VGRIILNKHIFFLVSLCFLIQTISCSTKKNLIHTEEKPIRCAVDGIKIKSLHIDKYSNVLTGQVLTYGNCLINVEKEYRLQTKYNLWIISGIPVVIGLSKVFFSGPEPDSDAPEDVQEEYSRQRWNGAFIFGGGLLLPQYIFRDSTKKKFETHQKQERLERLASNKRLTISLLGTKRYVKTDHQGYFTLNVMNLLKNKKVDFNNRNITFSYQGQYVTEKFSGTEIAHLEKQLLDIKGKPQAPPYPLAELTINKLNIAANDELKINVIVENKGKGSLYRLKGTINSSYPLLNKKEFNFGRILPGERKQLTRSIRIPIRSKDQEVSLKVNFVEHNDYIPPPQAVKISIRALSKDEVQNLYHSGRLSKADALYFAKVGKLSRPVLAYSYQVKDDITGTSAGNSDGIIQRGETIKILLTVKNNGKVEATNVVAKLQLQRKLTGIDFFKDRASLGNIASGELKQCDFSVAVKRTSTKGIIPLKLTLVETGLNVSVSKKLSLPLDDRIAPMVIVTRKKVTSTFDTDIFSGAGNNTSILAKVGRGQVLQVTGELSGWYQLNIPQIGKGWIQISKVKDYVALKPGKPKTKAPQDFTAQPQIIRVFQQSPPAIHIIEPATTRLETDRDRVRIAGAVLDDKGIKDFEIFVNDHKLTEGKGLILVRKANKTHRFDFEVLLKEGANKIVLKAKDNDNLEASEYLSITRTINIGNIWAAIIGIQDYKKIRKLDYAVNDAVAMADYLKSHLEVPSDHIHVLLDEEATKKNISKLLGTTLREKAGKDDSIIIYYSGHGVVEPDPNCPDGDGLEKYLAPVDTDREDLYSTGISMEEIKRIFNRIRAERIIFIADTCFSGASGGRTFLTTETKTEISDGFLRRLTEGKGRIILAASGANEVSHEDSNLKHGVFTFFLLKALKGAGDDNHDGYITVDEAYRYVSEEVPKATRQTQMPIKKGEVKGQIYLGKVK